MMTKTALKLAPPIHPGVGILVSAEIPTVAFDVATGLLVTLLVTHKTWPILIAGIFFAALQVGGLAMQRSAGVSWQLAQVLQAVVILSLTMRIVISQRRTIRSNNV